MGNYTSMFIYIVIYTIATILIAEGIKKNSRSVIIIGILIPVLFAAFRYQVGTDYLNYVYAYQNACKNKLSFFINGSFSLEIGLNLISKISNLFGDTKVFFGLFAFLIIYPVVYRLKNNYTTVSLHIALFWFFMTYFTSGLNIMRQALAASIIFWGFEFIFKGELKKYLIVVIVAMTFHVSAVIALPIFFLWDRKEYKVKINFKIVSFLIVVLIVSLNISKIIGIISNFSIFSRYETYELTSVGGENRSFLLKTVSLIPILFLSKRLANIDKRNGFFILLMVVSTCLEFTGFFSPYVKRIGIYFEFGSFLIWAQLPYLFVKNDRIIVKYIILLYRIGLFWLTYVVMKQSGIIPYNIGGV